MEAVGDCIMRIFIRYYYGDHLKGYEMGGAHSSHGRDKKYVRSFD
jgi:hypothetical protein